MHEGWYCTMKIGCISWSHRNEFGEGKLDLLKWIEHCKIDCKLDGVELWNNSFASTDADYLDALVQKSRELGIPIYSVASKCVFGDFSSKFIEECKNTLNKWLGIADSLNAPLLRISVGGNDLRNPKHQTIVFKTLSAVLEENRYPQIRVGIENQEPGVVQNAVDVFKMRKDSDNLLWLILDNGSFINKSDSYDFLKDTLEVAAVVHTKFYDINKDGSDNVLDYNRIKNIINESGYDGFLSIEYDSDKSAIENVPIIAEYMRNTFCGER